MLGDPDYKRELSRQMRSLSRRSRSLLEVRNRLQDRGVSQNHAEEIIDELVKHGFLDDCRYAGEYTRTRLKQGYGPSRIRRDLIDRGVSESFIAAALSEETEDLPIEKILGETIAKRIRIKGEPRTPQQLKNLADFLTRRGFNRESIRSELANYYNKVFKD